MQAKLRERDDTEQDHRATKGEETKAKDFSTAEFSNPAALLKPRLARWKANNLEKKNLMDMYIRNVKIIEDAFEQIKEQTGISSTEEIVTTFVKAEEQNYSLYNYVNMLNSDIDMIEEQNKSIEQEIKRHEQLSSMSEQEKAAARENLQKEIEEMKEKNGAKEAQITDIETQMVEIKDHVHKMVVLFDQSHFSLAVASHMHYDEDTVFNENNVTMYLSELEEFVSNFITYLAQREKNPDAPISALSLDAMANKEFDKGAAIIDVPSAHDFANVEDDTTEGGDDIVVNPKELYRKFEELTSKGYINPASGAQGASGQPRK